MSTLWFRSWPGHVNSYTLNSFSTTHFSDSVSSSVFLEGGDKSSLNDPKKTDAVQDDDEEGEEVDAEGDGEVNTEEEELEAEEEEEEDEPPTTRSQTRKRRPRKDN